MLDFMIVSTRRTKSGIVEIYPRFIINNESEDLMIRGSDFYAIWCEERGLWSTKEQDALRLIDHELDKYKKENKEHFDGPVKVLHMWDAESGMIDRWHKYCQKQSRDNYHMLDETLIFSNSETRKTDYASKRLPYPLEAGNCPSWNKLIGTLYTPEEREKIEWAIGAIVSGDSKTIQKFLVLYGAAGTGKSTILGVIEKLFAGYYSVFDAKALGSSNNSFALEAFKTNPLVAIQHDGDLSRIEDNTRLNSLVSHELMTVNEKFKSAYSNSFKCFLFMGTNKPVKITDAKSGLIRRLIDVTPSGNKLAPKEYKATIKNIDFELGAIAHHCQEVYLSDPGKYNDYIPISMMGASNDFYNYIVDSYSVFKKEDGTTLRAAWEMYKNYCDDAKVSYPFSQRIFKEELKNYFLDYKERHTLDDGTRVRSYYIGFDVSKFEKPTDKPVVEPVKLYTINFGEYKSIFDSECSECPAQYANANGRPTTKWAESTTKLDDIDTSKLHYVQVPVNHIVIDFDIPDENGGKSYERNLEAASKLPPTYAELSKSGRGIHLHYIYAGDATKLSSVYDDHIEVKVFTGNSSLRRQLTKCNDIPIATISSGLPLKGEDKLINFDSVQTEKGLRTLIKRNLCKEYHPGTKPSIDFIYKILDDAYNSDLKYDVSDMIDAIISFAAGSTHQADYCLSLVNKMKFKSDDISEPTKDKEAKLVFYDIEVFPNLLLVNWKFAGEGKPVVRMINPTPSEIVELMSFNLVGFNCRRYDNHIIYARMLGYSNEELYNLSQAIIGNQPNCMFGEAYNVSYTDVYDFASAGNKKSLKKLEIEMGIHHQELGLPWDKPVPEELWEKVAEYCDNDVIATEAAFHYLKADWTARQILADLAEMTVNDTTNSLTTRIIFGRNRKPQGEFCYRDMSKPVYELDPEVEKFLKEVCPVMMSKRHGEAKSLLPYFPGYKYEYGKSTYRGTDVGEGGNVYAQPGIWIDVALLDIVSMHPHSAMAECVFGPRFTRAFHDIVEGRVNIKHEAWNIVSDILDGKLKPYIQKVLNGEMTSGELADALKTAINSVYGLTAAKFENPFRDPRNVDNIVAKRGALFMEDLKYEVQKLGYAVAHIKTDSIKIPNATPEIIQFVMDFGQDYGYTFEHEATYDRMCLVNDAVYIAKYATVERCIELYGKDYVESDSSVCKKNKKKAGKWDATGTQFQVPYVFKTLFSKEPIDFDDTCETKSVGTALYLDMNEGLNDVTPYETLKDIRKKSPEDMTRKEAALCQQNQGLSDKALDEMIAEGHCYIFVGKVGRFCPIKPGCGGGELLREGTDAYGNLKYSSATGAKGYRWLESEMVRELGKQDDVDKNYYRGLVDAAIAEISKYGDFERFVADEPYVSIDIPEHPIDDDSDLPWYLSDRELEELVHQKAAQDEQDAFNRR